MKNTYRWGGARPPQFIDPDSELGKAMIAVLEDKSHANEEAMLQKMHQTVKEYGDRHGLKLLKIVAVKREDKKGGQSE